MKNKYYYLLFFMLIAFSCHKKDNSTAPAQDIFTKDSFPLAVGDWWQYQVTYYPGESMDTIVMSAVSMTTIGSSIDYKCNILLNGSIIDSGHFIQSDTSLYYNGCNPNFSYLGFYNLKFPFTAGQKWPGIYPGDTLRVLGYADSFQAVGHVYSPYYSIYREYNIPHRILINYINLTPKIGLINQSINLQSDTGPYEWLSMQLINYNVH